MVSFIRRDELLCLQLLYSVFANLKQSNNDNININNNNNNNNLISAK